MLTNIRNTTGQGAEPKTQAPTTLGAAQNRKGRRGESCESQQASSTVWSGEGLCGEGQQPGGQGWGCDPPPSSFSRPFQIVDLISLGTLGCDSAWKYGTQSSQVLPQAPQLCFTKIHLLVEVIYSTVWYKNNL